MPTLSLPLVILCTVFFKLTSSMSSAATWWACTLTNSPPIPPHRGTPHGRGTTCRSRWPSWRRGISNRPRHRHRHRRHRRRRRRCRRRCRRTLQMARRARIHRRRCWTTRDSIVPPTPTNARQRASPRHRHRRRVAVQYRIHRRGRVGGRVGRHG